MPTFDYRCSSCDNVQEEFHSISNKPDIICNECGSRCEKIFTATTAFVLKGGDWPSKGMREKKQMLKKNAKMSDISNERSRAGESVHNIGDLKKKKGL